MPSIAPNEKSQYGRGLAEGSWKGMKKYLEQEMLCPELKDRIRFHYEVYPRFGGSSAVFSVSLDERRIKAFGLMYALTRLQEQGKLKPGCYIWTIPVTIYLPHVRGNQPPARDISLPKLVEWRGNGLANFPKSEALVL